MDPREMLTKQIQDADLKPSDKDLLLRRLKVASHEGAAHVRRDFEECIVNRRAELCPSGRRTNCNGKQSSPQDKKAVIVNFA